MSRVKQYQKGEFEDQINTLKKLGFTNDEALIYHVILISKECTVGEISRSINFSRSKIYGVIDNLLSEGIVVEGSTHPKSYYPIDPREIAEKRLKEIKSFDQSVSKRLDALEATIEDQKEQINALQRRVGSGGDATIVADVEELRKQVELLGD